MPGPLWRRQRNRTTGAGDAPSAGDPVTRADAQEPVRVDDSADGITSRLGPDLDGSRLSADYTAWAERMREKRSRSQAQIAGLRDDPAVNGPGAHWTVGAVFDESRRVEEMAKPDRVDPWDVRAALATLGLAAGASIDEVEAAYRRLARDHHPDRHPDADAATRAEHEERFRALTAARGLLRSSVGR